MRIPVAAYILTTFYIILGCFIMNTILGCGHIAFSGIRPGIEIGLGFGSRITEMRALHQGTLDSNTVYMYLQ